MSNKSSSFCRDLIHCKASAIFSLSAENPILDNKSSQDSMSVCKKGNENFVQYSTVILSGQTSRLKNLPSKSLHACFTLTEL